MDKGKLKALELIKKAAVGSLIPDKADAAVVEIELEDGEKSDDKYECPHCGKGLDEWCQKKFGEKDEGSDESEDKEDY